MSISDPLPPSLEEELAHIPAAIDRGVFQRSEQTRLKLILYLIPFVGFLPALWSLYHEPLKSPKSSRQNPKDNRSRKEGQAARLAVTSGGLWAVMTVLLSTGALTGDGIGLGMLVWASLLTSSYFIVNVSLMIQVLRRQRLYLVGLSEVSQNIIDRSRTRST